MLRGSSESSGMSSEEVEHIDKEMSSSTNFPTPPTSPTSTLGSGPHKHGTFRSMIRGSGESKEKKMEKKKKQMWIFVADVGGAFCFVILQSYHIGGFSRDDCDPIIINGGSLPREKLTL